MGIKSTLKSFREFFQQKSRLSEMSMGQSTSQSFKLPPNALWLLSFMPDPQAQSSAILWLLNQGLYDACKGRKELAQIASEKLGRHVLENEIFSKAAHEEDPKLGQLYQTELKPLWIQKYEPKVMKIKEHKGHKIIERVVSIKDLNQYIMQQGLPAFHFGGTGGLIEWLEDGAGKWGDSFSSHSPIHGKPSQERDGLDLSNPDFVQDEETKKSYFSFGSNEDPKTKFLPPHSESTANEYRRSMALISGDQIRDALERDTPGNLPDSTLNWLKNNQQNISKEQEEGLGTRTSGARGSDEGKEVQIPEDEWELVVDYIKKGMIEFNKTKKSNPKIVRPDIAEHGNKPWTDQDMHIMLYGGSVDVGQKEPIKIKGLLDPQNHIIRDKVNDPLWLRVVCQLAKDAGVALGSSGWNQYNQRLSKTFMDIGLKNRTSGDPIPEKSVQLINYTFPNVKAQDFVHDTTHENTHDIDLSDLLNNGYTIDKAGFFGPVFDKLDMDAKLAKVNELKDGTAISLVKGPSEYIVADKLGGSWKIRKVISSNPTKTRKWEGSALLTHGGKFGASSKFSAPVDEVTAAKLKSQWYGNPESFADEMVNVGNLNVPRSLKEAIKFGRSQFNNFNKDNDEAKSWAIKIHDEQLIGGATIGIAQVFGTWMFKYGDPLGKWNGPKSKGGLDADNKNSIYTLLAEKGIQGEQAKHYIEELYKAANEKRSPDFPPEVEQAFLQNGFNWRAYKGADGVVQQLNVEFKNSTQGVPTFKGDDGEHKQVDISNDVRTSNLINNTIAGGKIKKVSGTNVSTNVNADDIIKSSEEKANTDLFKKSTIGLIVPDLTDPNEVRKINVSEDSSYKNLYQHMMTSLDAVKSTVNPHDDITKSIENAQHYTYAIQNVITNNLSSVRGKTISPRSRGVIDAAGDALVKKLINIIKVPQKTDSDMILMASILERFFLDGPGNLKLLAAKHNAGDIKNACDQSLSYIQKIDPNFIDEVHGGLEFIRQKARDFDKKQSTPPVAVGPQIGAKPGVATPAPTQAEPDYSQGYTMPDDDVVKFTPKPQQPATAMNQQRQTAIDSRNPLVAMRKPLPNTKAEHFMVSFKEWKNWKLIEHLKNG